MNWIVNQHSYTAQRVFCIGRNYVEHIAELGNERPEQPQGSASRSGIFPKSIWDAHFAAVCLCQKWQSKEDKGLPQG